MVGACDPLETCARQPKRGTVLRRRILGSPFAGEGSRTYDVYSRIAAIVCVCTVVVVESANYRKISREQFSTRVGPSCLAKCEDRKDANEDGEPGSQTPKLSRLDSSYRRTC